MIAAIYARTLTGRRLLLAEIPQGELGLVDRAAEEIGDDHERQAWTVWLGTADVVEGLQQLATQVPLVLGTSVREFSPPGTAIAWGRRGRVEGVAVVRRPAHRIAQHAVGVSDVMERLAVAGLLVVRVVKGGEQPVSLGYDQGLGRPADLKHLVVVRSVRRMHWTKALSTVQGPEPLRGGVPSHVEKRNGAFLRLMQCTINRPP